MAVSELPLGRELLLQVREREVLLPRLDADVEPVLQRREREHVVVAERAVRVVREVEVEHVLVIPADREVEVAGRAVALLPARRVPERDEEALLVLPGLRDRLVRLEPSGLAIDRELEVSPLQHLPWDTLRRDHRDRFRLRVADELNL